MSKNVLSVITVNYLIPVFNDFAANKNIAMLRTES